MPKNKNETGTPETTATSVAPKKVRGLLGLNAAELNGEAWVLDESDPLAGIGLGLGASPEAKRLVLLGLFYEHTAEIDKKLTDLKPQKGAPKKEFSIDVKRAAAVLSADDFVKCKTGTGVATQKEAIEVATQIDKILCDAGERDKPWFSSMTSMKSIQNSVSAGLSELGPQGERFLKK